MTTGTPTDTGTPQGNMPDAWTLTPAEATARLAAMTVQHSDAALAKAEAKMTKPQLAAAKLEKLGNDPDWRRKFENGDVAARDEWQALIAAQNDGAGANTVEDIAAGRAVPPQHEIKFDGALGTRELMQTAEDLREIGIPPQGIAAVLRGDKFSEADVKGAQAWLAEAAHTPEFVKNLMEGEPTVVREFTARNAIVAAGMKEE